MSLFPGTSVNLANFHSLYREPNFPRFSESFVKLSRDNQKLLVMACVDMCKQFRKYYNFEPVIKDSESLLRGYTIREAQAHLTRAYRAQNEQLQFFHVHPRMTLLNGWLRRKLDRFETDFIEEIRKLRELVDRMWGAFSADMKTLKDKVTRVEHNVDFNEWYLSESDLMLEVCRLIGRFGEGEVAYSKAYKMLRVTTEPITLDLENGHKETVDSVDMGRFDIYLCVVPFARLAGKQLSPEQIMSNEECRPRLATVITVLPAGEAVNPHPTRIKEDESSLTFFHPHVDNNTGEVCFGLEASRLANRIFACDLTGAIDVALEVISNYNEKNPYLHLENWLPGVKKKCFCGSYYFPSQMVDCGRCSNEVCETCKVACDRCDDTVCPSCYTSCNSCSKRYCDGCRDKKLFICSRCEEYTCGSCRVWCCGVDGSDCEEMLCHNCAYTYDAQCADCADREEEKEREEEERLEREREQEEEDEEEEDEE